MSKHLLLLCPLTCLMLGGLVQMFVHGETEQKNNNAQLLLPYNSE